MKKSWFIELDVLGKSVNTAPQKPLFSKAFFQFSMNDNSANCALKPFLYTAWKVSVFGVILVRIFSHLYSVRMRENTDQANSKYKHFSRSDTRISNEMKKCLNKHLFAFCISFKKI